MLLFVSICKSKPIRFEALYYSCLILETNRMMNNDDLFIYESHENGGTIERKEESSSC